MNADLNGMAMRETVPSAGHHRLAAFTAQAITNHGDTLPPIGHQRIVVRQQSLRDFVPELQNMRIAFQRGLSPYRLGVLKGQQVFQNDSHGNNHSQVACRWNEPFAQLVPMAAFKDTVSGARGLTESAAARAGAFLAQPKRLMCIPLWSKANGLHHLNDGCAVVAHRRFSGSSPKLGCSCRAC
jgi:hypothetical protein